MQGKSFCRKKQSKIFKFKRKKHGFLVNSCSGKSIKEIFGHVTSDFITL